MEDIIEEKTETIVNIEDTTKIEEPQEPMEKPKKPRSQKQMDALKKAQESLRLKREAKKNENALNMNIKTKPKNSVQHLLEEDEDENDEPVIVKKKPKKKKNRIVIEEDSSDDDQEIVISRRRKGKGKTVEAIEKSEPIDIPIPHEEIVEEEPNLINPEVRYTRQQILRAYGL